MQTVFALFDQFADAAEAIEDLHHEGVYLQDMNVIVQENVAKAGMVGGGSQEPSRDIEQLLGARRPVNMPGIGKAYVVGHEATIVNQAAQPRGGADAGMSHALADWLARPAAEIYTRGVASGGLLLWVRAADDRTATVANLMRMHHGREVKLGGAHSALP